VDSGKPVLPQRNSIDYIFNQVKDYDLVLTKESSLADAINDRYDGESELAYTPRQLVDEENSGFRRKIFLELVEKNQMSWRQASYLLRNILDCWQQTGELNSIKQYDRFEGDALDRIIEVLTEVENPYSKLEKHSIEAEKVAVIGLDRFKALEKRFYMMNLMK